jgi:2-deoxystreptamine N-acetyl-D-glucosaminyltransferase/2-deoxystreptamine glucosyltransferase
VIVEALTHGKPSVASLVGGIPEVVREGITGVLLPPADRQAWAASLAELAADKSALKEMANACFDLSVEYSTEKISRAYLDLYERSLTGRS